MPIEIIKGQAGEHQGDAAELIWITDERLTDYLFKGKDNWKKMAAIDWPSSDGMLCHRRSCLAKDGDEIVGIVVTHDPVALDRHFEVSTQRWKSAASPSLAKHLDQAFESLAKLYPHPSPNCMYVLELAVNERHRRRGIGRLLLEEAVREATSLGRLTLALDVEGCSDAVAFYRA